jgi:hypothetical protein
MCASWSCEFANRGKRPNPRMQLSGPKWFRQIKNRKYRGRMSQRLRKGRWEHFGAAQADAGWDYR